MNYFKPEIERKKKEEFELQKRIEDLKNQEEQIKQSQHPLKDSARQEQANTIAEQRKLVEDKLSKTIRQRQIDEAALNVIDKLDENKKVNENRGNIDNQQNERDKIASQQKTREENFKTAVGVAKEYNQVVEGKFGADPLVGAIVAGVAAVKVGKEIVNDLKIAEKIGEVKGAIKSKFTEKDPNIEWEKDISLKEQKLQEDHKKQVDALEKNKLLLEIQKDDAKKFPDADKKLEQLKPMDELVKKEEKIINGKFSEGMDEAKREREALQNNIKREEFKRQIELEKRKLEEQDRKR